jgi:hypothetical protein
MVRENNSLRYRIEELENIPICNLIYIVMLDITDHLLEIKYGNKYVLVAIDHYSKWCEVKPVKEHIVIVVAILLEKEIICRFGVPKYVFVDNCG